MTFVTSLHFTINAMVIGSIPARGNNLFSFRYTDAKSALSTTIQYVMSGIVPESQERSIWTQVSLSLPNYVV